MKVASHAQTEEGASMMMLANRFKYLMMDERAALAARLIAAGATFWGAGGGAMTVAQSATVVTVSRREAQQVAGLLGVRCTEDAQQLDRASVQPAVLSMVLEDSEALLEAEQILPAAHRPRLRELA